MGEIAFTQYLRPNGRTKTVYMPMNNDVVLKKAEEIKNAGLAFEIEVLRTGEVSATITEFGVGDIAHVVALNNEDLTVKLQKMILDFEPRKPAL